MSGLWKGMKEAQEVPGDLGGRSSLEYGNNHESNRTLGPFVGLFLQDLILP
jgi:hypothetical protein